MPTTWTDVTKPTTTYSAVSSPGTTWNSLEPVGFGVSPFGDPSNIEAGMKIHQRGFGDLLTKWTNI